MKNSVEPELELDKLRRETTFLLFCAYSLLYLVLGLLTAFVAAVITGIMLAAGFLFLVIVIVMGAVKGISRICRSVYHEIFNIG